MVLLPNNENLNMVSGIINMPFLEDVYVSFMNEGLLDLGGRRGPVIFHLPPLVQQDNVTQSKPAPQQYNPFFSRVPVPLANTRNTGTKVTHRDVQYTAHIKLGPLKDMNGTGMGDLSDNEGMLTVVIEALHHVQQSLSVSIEGRRYTVVETRPIGFSIRRYLMIKIRAIPEEETPSPNITIG